MSNQNLPNQCANVCIAASACKQANGGSPPANFNMAVEIQNCRVKCEEGLKKGFDRPWGCLTNMEPFVNGLPQLSVDPKTCGVPFATCGLK